MRKTKYWIFIFSFIPFTSLYAQAGQEQSSPQKFYAAISYIYSNPYDSDNEMRDSVILQKNRWFIGPQHIFQQASGVELAAGYNLINFLKLELAGSYIPNYKGNFRITDVQNDYHQQDYTYDLYNFSINALLITELIPALEGYFKFGAGLLIRERKVKGSIRINMIVISNFQNYSDSYLTFSYKLGYGLKWWIYNRAPIIIEFYNLKGTQKLDNIRNWNLLFGINYIM